MKKIQYPMLPDFQIKYFILAICFIVVLSPVFSQTGNEETKQEIKSDTTKAEEETTSEKKELRMSLEAFKINQELKLVARVRSKANAKFQNTAGVKVSF